MLRLVRVSAILLLVAACASSGHMSVAQRAQRIEGQVWSPYCPGKLLIDCTTTQAGQLRDRITREIRRGRSDTQVLRGIREDFGNGALARPPSGGAGVLIWLVPFMVFALGATLVVWLVRKRRPEPVAPPATAPPPSADLQKLRDEVRRRL
jgi:cytochrome c-type biogenesis protein CcmH/NrfF